MSFLVKTLVFIFQIAGQLIYLYSIVVLVACLLSFVSPDPYNPIVRFIRNLTEPAFAFVRRLLPFTVVGGLDLSPFILIIGLQFISSVLLPELLGLIAGLLSGGSRVML